MEFGLLYAVPNSVLKENTFFLKFGYKNLKEI